MDVFLRLGELFVRQILHPLLHILSVALTGLTDTQNNVEVQGTQSRSKKENCRFMQIVRVSADSKVISSNLYISTSYTTLGFLPDFDKHPWMTGNEPGR